MGSSAKKKKEKKKDFTKPKLKVGKTRPKDTNATSTDFAAKSINIKQQNLSSTSRDGPALFSHNLSLLTSRNETQRRDALGFLTTYCAANDVLPQAPATVLAKAQALILDGSQQVRNQLLKLLQALSMRDLGPLDQCLLYTRAGLAHLSADIRSDSLKVLDWMLDVDAEAVFACPGGWVRTMRTFVQLLGWAGSDAKDGNWTASKTTGGSSGAATGAAKARVSLLNTLARFLTAGLAQPAMTEPRAKAERRAALLFPCWHTDAHLLATKSNPFGPLNLFATQARDVDGDVYADAEERGRVLVELGLRDVLERGCKDVKREGGEVGRAGKGVERSVGLVDAVG